MTPTTTPPPATLHDALREVLADAQGAQPDPFADSRQQVARLSERLPKVESADEATEIAVQLIGLAAYLLGSLEAAAAHQVALGQARERADTQARAATGRIALASEALDAALHKVPAAALSVPGVASLHRDAAGVLDLLRKPLANAGETGDVAPVASTQETAP